MPNTPKRILIISSSEDEESTNINNVFVGQLQERLQGEVELKWVNYHEFLFEFDTDRLEVRLRSDNTPLSSFDFVYFKSYFRYSELAGVIATYLEHTGTPFVSSELKNHIPLTKLSQFARLAVAGLPIIKTIFMLRGGFASAYGSLESQLGSPFIFKAIDGSGGDENFLIRDEQQFQDALQAFPNLQFVAQSFVQNDSDYRVLIVGDSIELVIKRERHDDSTHLNNTSQGAKATLMEVNQLDPRYRQLCLKAAQVMQREIAGVDLLFESGTNKPFILEVNASPQIGSGAFMEEKLQIYSNYYKNMVK